MKKRDKPFGFSKKMLECLMVLLMFGLTTFAASKSSGDVSTYDAVEGSVSGDDVVYTTEGSKWENVGENTWTMDKDDDKKPDITLVKKGDQWEYLFNVADPYANYYGWENSVPDGYQVVGKGERTNPAIRSLKQMNEVKYSHTPNISDDGVQSGNYANNLNLNDVVTIPGASKLHVKLTYAGESASYDYACIWEGSHSDYRAANEYSWAVSIGGTQKFGGGTGTTVECDIVGDTVTFGYRSDSSVCGNGYGYYAVVTGYSYSSDGFSITNEQTTYSEPEYGSLALSKVLTGNDTDPDQNFRFNITLSSKDEDLAKKFTGTTTFGNITFNDGQGTAYLKGGESIDLTNIPAGTDWKITETAVDGYTTTMKVDNNESSNKSKMNTVNGTITTNHKTAVEYTNTKNKQDSGGSGDTPVTPTGSFTVKKLVENGSDTDEFTFAAALTGLGAEKSYAMQITKADGSTSDTMITSNAAGSAYQEFKLKNKETAKFKDLPVGSNYMIQENKSEGYTASYKITDESGDDSKLNVKQDRYENPEADQDLKTNRETLDQDEQALITFTNKKPAPKPDKDAVDIVVKKKWDDNKDAKNLRPSEVNISLYQSTSKNEDGDMVATATLDASQADADGNWTTMFEDMDKYPENKYGAIHLYGEGRSGNRLYVICRRNDG